MTPGGDYYTQIQRIYYNQFEELRTEKKRV